MGEAGAADELEGEIARKIIDSLIDYARYGTGRPPGALTPSEARSAIDEITGSKDLGNQAETLVARCDGCLFSKRPPGHHDVSRLVTSARELFQALGRVSAARTPQTPISEWPAHESE